MKNKLIVAGLLTLATSIGASAESFSTSVDVTKVLTPISISQTTQMVLPQITVDISTPVNTALCETTNTDWHVGKNYCSTTGVNGMYRVTGQAHATAHVSVPSLGIAKDGFTFQAFGIANGSTAVPIAFDAAGNFDLELRGRMTLNDLSAVTTKAYVFDFDLVSTYY